MADPTPAARISRDAPDYPSGLLDLTDPPAVLHVRGALAPARCVAIVGSRSATPYGLAFARRLATDLSALGFAIVSGLARGIDAAAHLGALDAGGVTLAVLPAGIDTVTPPSHGALAERIVARGALLAERPVGTSVRPAMFVERNRLIAALGCATIVVEAAVKSGAGSTAAVARTLGRPLLAVPGDVDRPTSRGCHALLRQGALVCEGAGDVLRALSQDASALAPRRVAACAARTERGPRAAAAADVAVDVPDAQRVVAALAAQPRSVEAIANDAALSVERVLAALLQLEWSSVADSHPGQRWSLRGAPTK